MLLGKASPERIRLRNYPSQQCVLPMDLTGTLTSADRIFPGKNGFRQDRLHSSCGQCPLTMQLDLLKPTLTPLWKNENKTWAPNGKDLIWNHWRLKSFVKERVRPERREESNVLLEPQSREESILYSRKGGRKSSWRKNLLLSLGL